jgi:hypothetical protein
VIPKEGVSINLSSVSSAESMDFKIQLPIAAKPAKNPKNSVIPV